MTWANVMIVSRKAKLCAVYERTMWDPTPIPDQPLEANVNLWHSRSTRFSGPLDTDRLPACTEVRLLAVSTSGSALEL